MKQKNIEKDIFLEQYGNRITELQSENASKTKQIIDLQTNLGSVTAFYFNLKNKLFDAFWDMLKSLFQQPHGFEDPPTASSQPSESDFHVDPPPPRTTTIVDRFEKEPDNARPRITIRHGKNTVTADENEGLLFMKNSNDNCK